MHPEYDPEETAGYEGECQGCDIWARVGDLGLCSDCTAKLERDLIREREWDYSVAAHGVSPEGREELRALVIRQYGEELELIAPEKKGKKKRGTKKRKARPARKKRRKRKKR